MGGKGGGGLWISTGGNWAAAIADAKLLPPPLAPQTTKSSVVTPLLEKLSSKVVPALMLFMRRSMPNILSDKSGAGDWTRQSLFNCPHPTLINWANLVISDRNSMVKSIWGTPENRVSKFCSWSTIALRDDKISAGFPAPNSFSANLNDTEREIIYNFLSIYDN